MNTPTPTPTLRPPGRKPAPLFSNVPLSRHELTVILRALARAQTGGMAATREEREEYWLLARTLELHLEGAAA